ncbi:MAG: GIY-YIG nuclease family protein [Candidatus Omnitrophica bacterium]|nr:GIY-YIG nuclease family protein [Candidatus Omnitrophota bacterium]
MRKKIADAPDAPGVYLMKDAEGKVIYIGKAKSLKKRLLTYLSRDLSSKTVALMSCVWDVEYRTSRTESLALLLEASLIHQYKPKYNISLRDDKSFPLVKITREEFPRIYITRKKEPDKAFYLGPYTNPRLLREALKIIRRSFPYRSCKKLPKKACIYFRLGLSPAPCINKVSRKEYARTIKNITLALKGKTDLLIERLFKRMYLKSKELKFEEAAKIRDQINALSVIGQNKVGFSTHDELEDLKNLLRLSCLPERIEAFDISNISGREATGSMASFYRGNADKNNYRRFRIKTVDTIDDYKMLREVLQRRYSRMVREKSALPDLILIDGGKSHLSTAHRELEKLGLKLPLVSIAKEKENIYTQRKIKPIRLDSDTPALNLIRRIRDEAHRFAISYHHILRKRKILGR